MGGERIDQPCTLTVTRGEGERELLLTPRELAAR